MLNPPSQESDSFEVILSKDIRWKKSSIKSNSLLANVIYKMKANEEGVDELIMSDNGCITEVAVSNIF